MKYGSQFILADNYFMDECGGEIIVVLTIGLVSASNMAIWFVENRIGDDKPNKHDCHFSADVGGQRLYLWICLERLSRNGKTLCRDI